MRPMAVRAHARKLAVTAAVAGAVALAGCGTAAAPGSGQSGPSTAATAKVSLTFTLTNGKGQAPKRWTLRCDPAGGSQPHPAAACRALLAMKKPFALPSRHVICPMIVVSDRTIMVTGTWFGQEVRRVITDGACDLNMFDKIMKFIR
jgi:hypothetical protein